MIPIQFIGRKYKDCEHEVRTYYKDKHIFRVLNEKSVITCEHNGSRVNVVLNDNGYIVDINEG